MNHPTQTVEPRNRVIAANCPLIAPSAFYPPLSEVAHDEREISGEAIPTGRYLFGGGLYYGEGEGEPASLGETRFIVGVLAVCAMTFGALAFAVWLWSRGIVVWR